MPRKSRQQSNVDGCACTGHDPGDLRLSGSLLLLLDLAQFFLQQFELLSDRIALLLFLMFFQGVLDEFRTPGDFMDGFTGKLLDLIGAVIFCVTNDPGRAGRAAGIPAMVKVVVSHLAPCLIRPLHPFSGHVPAALRAADQPGQHMQAAGVACPQGPTFGKPPLAVFIHFLAHEGRGGKIDPFLLVADRQAVDAFSQQGAVLVYFPLMLAEDGFAHIDRALQDALHGGSLPEEAVARRCYVPALQLVRHFVQR